MIPEHGGESVMEDECLGDAMSASVVLLSSGTDSMAEVTNEYVLPSSGVDGTTITTHTGSNNMRKKTFSDTPQGSMGGRDDHKCRVFEDHGNHDRIGGSNHKPTDDDISIGDDDKNTIYHNKRVVSEEMCVRQSDIHDDTRGDDDSSDTMLNTDDENRMVGEDASVVKCIFRRGRCVTHGCDTKSFKVSIKKWQWIARKKEYGYVSSKTTRYICLNLVEGRVAPGKASLSSGSNISQQQRDVGVEVGRIFGEENTISQQQRAVQNGAPEYDERESFVCSGPTSMTEMYMEDYQHKT